MEKMPEKRSSQNTTQRRRSQFSISRASKTRNSSLQLMRRVIIRETGDRMKKTAMLSEPCGKITATMDLDGIKTKKRQWKKGDKKVLGDNFKKGAEWDHFGIMSLIE